MKSILISALTALALLSTGCVSKQTHEATLAELGKTRDSLSGAQRLISDQQDQIDTQTLQIAKNTAEIEQSNMDLQALENKKSALQEEFENVQARLNESQSQLETMRQIEAETKKRNEIYARFVNELQKMIDGGQLTVSIEQGRIVINLPENVLFASGQAAVNTEGKEALKQIAGVLKEFSERRFQIEGHTDNVPIKSARYPSNWELSTARALSVVHLMIDEGVQAQNVSAAGFGEFYPRAENETAQGRALNRRIEIIMLPNLDILSNELPKVTK